jgi:hypothetical protein
VLTVPDAEASSPGTRSHAEVQTVPPTSAGPLSVAGGAATADAGPQQVRGSATGGLLTVTRVLDVGASTSSVTLTGNAANGQVLQVATTHVSAIDVAGVLRLDDVTATARITVNGDSHAAQQALTIGGASVAGQAVTIGNDGVVAAGTPVVPGQTLAQATTAADAALSRAGVSVRTVGGVARHDARSAAADTGGVRISVATPGLPVGGIAGNSLAVLVGGASLTETDAPTITSDVLPPVQLPGSPAVPPSTTTTFVPGTPGTSGAPAGAVPPELAGRSVGYVLAGHRFTARAALAAFAAWQVLTLGLPTLYALVERRRRAALLEAR